MNQSGIKGCQGKIEFVVEQSHTIQFPAEGMPPVLSSPSLIWFLEHAAIEALRGGLEADEVSLGTEFQMQHLAPTPLGTRVTCIARIIQTENRSVGFQWEAFDDKGLIARGFHRRHVVRAASFARRLK